MNIIVLVSDTFRYDYLGCNGNAWIGTAALDRFAERAVCCDRHYLSSFPTIPNRTDLFTGRYSFPFHGWKASRHRYPGAEYDFWCGQLSEPAYLRHAASDEGRPPF